MFTGYAEIQAAVEESQAEGGGGREKHRKASVVARYVIQGL